MPPFDLELPATLEHLAEARHRLRAWLEDEVHDDVARMDLLAVAGEFFLHVIYRTGGLGRARVVAVPRDGGVRLAVTAADAVDGERVRAMAPAGDPLSAGAMGRRLVEGCCDAVQVAAAGSSTIGAECFRSVRSALR